MTRARSQAGNLAYQLRAFGAEVLELATIRIVPLDPTPLRAVLERLDAYRWLIFTSQNAVRIFFDELAYREGRAGEPGVARLAGVLVAAVGPATAEALRHRGVTPAVVPEDHVAEGLVQALRTRHDVAGSRVLYAAASEARDVLPDGLRALGATVDVIPIYRSMAEGEGTEGAEAVRRLLVRDAIDLVTFASASAVHGFITVVGPQLARRAPAASIGPVTSAAIRREGLHLAAEAHVHSIDGLVDAVVRALT